MLIARSMNTISPIVYLVHMRWGDEFRLVETEPCRGRDRILIKVGGKIIRDGMWGTSRNKGSGFAERFFLRPISFTWQRDLIFFHGNFPASVINLHTWWMLSVRRRYRWRRCYGGPDKWLRSFWKFPILHPLRNTVSYIWLISIR